ncbi:MAG: helix-turn-helix domain-containing protein [Gammaproteobacteria bacterium]
MGKGGSAAGKAPGKRARTRAALIEAAAAVIGEKGYDRTTLEDVAQRAGMSRGAIYGNFKDKEELFLALVATRWQPILPEFQAGRGLREQLRALGRAVASAARERIAMAAAVASFQLYALTHEHMRERMHGENARVYRSMAKQLAEHIAPEDLPMPALQFVKVLDALTTGLLFTYFQTPRLIREEDFVAAFEALAPTHVVR